MIHEVSLELLHWVQESADDIITAHYTFTLKGKSCEQENITHANIIIDHFYTVAGMAGVIQGKEYLLEHVSHVPLDIKLNISLQKNTQCSEARSLDITIWENLEFTPKVVRMFKWETIKVLLW